MKLSEQPHWSGKRQEPLSTHIHKGGEEKLVIEVVFQDEHGDFPVRTYVRKPPYSNILRAMIMALPIL